MMRQMGDASSRCFQPQTVFLALLFVFAVDIMYAQPHQANLSVLVHLKGGLAAPLILILNH